jgi:hypothetical protein
MLNLYPEPGLFRELLRFGFGPPEDVGHLSVPAAEQRVDSHDRAQEESKR